MPELTLESLAKRMQELYSLAARMSELELTVKTLIPAKPINGNVIPPSRDWRSVVGITEMTDFSRSMLTEMEAIREADREAARREFGELSSCIPII